MSEAKQGQTRPGEAERATHTAFGMYAGVELSDSGYSSAANAGEV